MRSPKQMIVEFFRTIGTTIWVKPIDSTGIAFIHVTAVLCYLFAMFQVAPILFEEIAPWKFYLFHIYGAWIFIAVVANIHLIRHRHSTIRNKFLPQPNIKPPPPELEITQEESCSNSKEGEGDRLLNERVKYLGQQFMDKPYGDKDAWHICGACEIFVPPRAWHCYDCKSCVLRRDHHCAFTMACIGEENHANFLSFLFYLAVGTTSCTIGNLIHEIYFLKTTIGWILVKMLVPLYGLLYEFSIIHSLAGTCFIGLFVAWVVFFYYLHLASQGMTAADRYRRIFRNKEGIGRYAGLKQFLGPNPFLRIVWPFYEAKKVSFGIPKDMVENAEELELKYM